MDGRKFAYKGRVTADGKGAGDNFYVCFARQSSSLHSNRTITDRGKTVVSAGLLLLGPSKKTCESERSVQQPGIKRIFDTTE